MATKGGVTNSITEIDNIRANFKTNLANKSSVKIASSKDISISGKGGDLIKQTLQQRHDHRNHLLYFLIISTAASAFLLFLLIGFQGWIRLDKPDYKILDQNQLEILSLSVFGEFISVIVVITKNVWDGQEIKNIDAINSLK